MVQLIVPVVEAELDKLTLQLIGSEQTMDVKTTRLTNYDIWI